MAFLFQRSCVSMLGRWCGKETRSWVALVCGSESSSGCAMGWGGGVHAHELVAVNTWPCRPKYPPPL